MVWNDAAAASSDLLRYSASARSIGVVETVEEHPGRIGEAADLVLGLSGELGGAHQLLATGDQLVLLEMNPAEPFVRGGIRQVEPDRLHEMQPCVREIAVAEVC